MKILIGVVLMLCMLFAVIVFLPDQLYQSITNKVVENLTGREFTISGLKTSRGIDTTVQVESIKLANADWAEQPDMLEIKNLLFSLDLAALLKGRLHLNKLTADSVDIDLVKNHAGEANWMLKKSKPSPGKPFSPERLIKHNLSHVALGQTRIRYIDEQKQRHNRLEIAALRLAQPQATKAREILAQGQLNDLPFSLNGRLGNMAAVDIETTLPLDLTATLNQSSVGVRGSLALTERSVLLNTTLTAHSGSLADLSVFLSRELPEIGPVNLAAEITADFKAIATNGIDVKDLVVDIDDAAIDLDISGALNGVLVENRGKLDIELSVNDLSKFLKLAGVNKDLPGTLRFSAAASGSGKDFVMVINEASLQSEFIEARARGKIKDLLNTAESELELEAHLPDLQIITQLFNRKMPPEWGPINAKGMLVGKSRRYSIAGIQAELNGKSNARVSGRVEDILGVLQMQLDAQATLSTLAEISAFTKRPLPDLGPMTATGKLSWMDGKLALTQAEASYTGPFGRAQVDGEIKDLVNFDLVRLNANARVPDLGIAELFSGKTMPKVGAMTATGTLISPVAKDLSITNIKANYDHAGVVLRATGAIDSLIKKHADLDLDVNADITSLSALNKIFTLDLPHLGPLSAKAKVSGIKEDIKISGINASLDDAVLSGTATGNLGRLIDAQTIDLSAKLNTHSLARLLTRFDIKSTINKPASVASQLSYKNGALHLNETKLDLAGGVIIGDLALHHYLQKSKRQKITGEINILNFDVLKARKTTQFNNTEQKSAKRYNPKRQDIGNIVAVEEVDVIRAEEGQARTTSKANANLLSHDPLPFSLIRNHDLDITLNIGRLRANVFDFENATVNIRAHNGIFQFGPFEGTLGGGNALLQFDVNATEIPAKTSFIARIDNFNMARAWAFRESKSIESSGDAFVNMAVHGRGESIAAIMADANGGGYLYFEDILLKKGTIDLFTTDLFRKTLNAINPFKKKQKDTHVKCGALSFRITDGVMTTPFGIAAEASEYSLTGNGEVNFNNETVDLEFKTKLKKLLAINPLEKLTGLVKVKGRLAEPHVTLNPRGIFEIGASIGIALATGGLSIIAQDQYEKLKAKSELCAQALGPAG